MPETTINRAKCVIVGDPAVGKTALTQTVLSEGSKFPKSYNLTFGVELSTKSLCVQESDKVIELLIYDSSGHDIYLDLLEKILKGSALMLAVYDVTSQQSLDNVATWVQLVKQSTGVKNIPAVLFGNKTDLTKRRTVSKEKAEEVAHRLGITTHMEGSAKDYDGVQEAFLALAQQYVS